MQAKTDVQELAEKMLEDWTPDKFCRFHSAIDKDGRAVSPFSPEAVKRCFYGEASYLSDHKPYDDAPMYNSYSADDGVYYRFTYAVQQLAEKKLGLFMLAPINDDNENGQEILRGLLEDLVKE